MPSKNHIHEVGKILLEVSGVVSSSLDPDKVSSLVLKESRRALKSDHASLFLMDENTNHLVLDRADGFSESEIGSLRLLGNWEAINNHLIRGKEPLVVNDVHRDAIFRDKKISIESFLAVPLWARNKVVGVLLISNSQRPGHLFTEEDKDLLFNISNNIAIAIVNAKLYHKMRSLFLGTITSLTRAIDAKDSYTSGHSERVMRYAVAIGREMKLDDGEIENLRLASLLHDIGKIGIKESILMKPAKLLGYEKRQVRLHPGIGARIIDSIDASHVIRRGILEHHERYDGKGYPNHLKGNEISLEGRIIAVADVFDALTTDRPYQKGCLKDEVFKRIEQDASLQFDPNVVAAFSVSYKKYPEIWKNKC